MEMNLPMHGTVVSCILASLWVVGCVQTPTTQDLQMMAYVDVRRTYVGRALLDVKDKLGAETSRRSLSNTALDSTLPPDRQKWLLATAVARIVEFGEMSVSVDSSGIIRDAWIDKNFVPDGLSAEWVFDTKPPVPDSPHQVKFEWRRGSGVFVVVRWFREYTVNEQFVEHAGVKDGRYTRWEMDGRLAEDGMYQAGARVGTWHILSGGAYVDKVFGPGKK